MLGGECMVTHHVTGTGKGTFDGTSAFLVRMGYEPTLLLDPWTGERVQYLPANRSAYALEHPAGQPETNRQGKVHVQIEWLWPAMSADITKAPHFAELWADLIPWLDDLGIPRRWPFGFTSTAKTLSKWTQGGHRGHVNAPGNSHCDNLPAPRQPAWPSEAKPLIPATRDAAVSLTKNLNGRQHPTDAEGRRVLVSLLSSVNRVLDL
jgi:hypothetical protein